jgi:hypothetical protein
MPVLPEQRSEGVAVAALAMYVERGKLTKLAMLRIAAPNGLDARAPKIA